MLRFQKFSAGFGWVPEYGNAENSPEEFAFLKAYSPRHTIRAGTAYPGHTGDDRRPRRSRRARHSFKFISALQAAQAGPDPVLVRVDVQAGHGAGKPTRKIIEEQADLRSFFFTNVGFTPSY